MMDPLDGAKKSLEDLEREKLVAEMRKLNADADRLEAQLYTRPAFWGAMATILATLFGATTLYVNGYFDANMAQLSIKEAEINEQIEAAEAELGLLRFEVAEHVLADTRAGLSTFFDRADFHLDMIWRLCSRQDGIVSQSLKEIGPESSDAHQVELMKRLNSIFVPLIQDNPHISSMMIVDSRGLEYVLLHEDLYESQVREYAPYEWRNRVMRLDDWGQRAIEHYWEDKQAIVPKGPPVVIPNITNVLGPIVVSGSAREYDPRYRQYARPWLLQIEDANTIGELPTYSEAAIHWTAPYVFHTTKTVGITASRAWLGEDGYRYVVAVDFTLTELSLATTELGVSDRGVAFVYTDDGAVIGLPRHKTFGSEKEILEFFQSVIEEGERSNADVEPTLLSVYQLSDRLGLQALTEAYRAWQNLGSKEATLSFTVGNESWTGTFDAFEYPKSDRTIWIAVIAPSEYLISSSVGDRAN